MQTKTPPSGFVPPAYPYDRLDAFAAIAANVPGGVVDCSIGTPCDPVPSVALEAGRAALATSFGYPPSIGSVELRAAAAGWLERRMSVRVSTDDVAACIGTKELVASLPQYLRLRDPSRDTVLHPAVAYPTYEMGAVLAGCRAVPVALDEQWRLDVSSIADADAERALVLWVNEPGNPTATAADAEWFAHVAAWGRERGVLVASDECYAEFAPEPATILRSGLDGVLAVHSLSKRSNFAGARVGFYAGDPDVVRYLRETRRHAGFMVPTALQAAAAAALNDDAHAAAQRAEYESRRSQLLEPLAAAGLVHAGGPTPFYLWLRDRSGADGWAIAERLARAGTLVSPGDLFGPAGAEHVRLALVQPAERLELVAERLVSADR
jgi:succinyldiaminopimelate transaminase